MPTLVNDSHNSYQNGKRNFQTFVQRFKAFCTVDQRNLHLTCRTEITCFSLLKLNRRERESVWKRKHESILKNSDTRRESNSHQAIFSDQQVESMLGRR